MSKEENYNEIHEDSLRRMKDEILAVFISCRRAMTINEFCNEYKRLVGKPLEYLKYGYADMECLIMDIPDVIKAIWVNGALKLTAIMDQENIKLESLLHVMKKSKKMNKNSLNTLINPLTNPSINKDIIVPRKWQDRIINIIKDYLTLNQVECVNIRDLEEIISKKDIPYPSEKYTLIGLLKRCYYFNINEDKTLISIKNMNDDILKNEILQLLDDFKEGIFINEFTRFYQNKYNKNFNIKLFGFDCVINMFKYYSSHLTLCLSDNGGLIKAYSKKHRIQIPYYPLQLHYNYVASISCINNSESFWIVIDDCDRTFTLQRYISALLISTIVDTDIIYNNYDLVLACSIKYNITWGRALVCDCESYKPDILVIFIDVGITDVVHSSSLSILPVPFDSLLYQIPRLAIHSKLPNKIESSDDASYYLYKCLSNKQISVKFMNINTYPLPVQIKRLSFLKCKNELSQSTILIPDLAEEMSSLKLLKPITKTIDSIH